MDFLSFGFCCVIIELCSPNRRNTIAGAGVSPPRGSHSWLAANGLNVLQKSSLSVTDTAANTIANGISAAPCTTSATAPCTHSTSKTAKPTKTTVSEAVEARVKLLESVNLSKMEDKVPSAVTLEKTIQYNDKGIQSIGLVAMSDYFDKKLTAMRGYIPLTAPKHE